jgi:hypothetical protein
MDSWQCSIGCGRLGLRRSWERLLLDASCGVPSDRRLCLLHTWDLLARLADKRGGHCGVLAAGSLDSIKGLASVFGGEVLNLGSLGADNV